jgi:hypothetical protein
VFSAEAGTGSKERLYAGFVEGERNGEPEHGLHVLAMLRHGVEVATASLLAAQNVDVQRAVFPRIALDEDAHLGTDARGAEPGADLRDQACFIEAAGVVLDRKRVAEVAGFRLCERMARVVQSGER